MYAKGRGVDQDYAEAAKLFRQAAERVSAPAERALGMLYFRGQGVPWNLFQAAKWWLRSMTIHYTG